MADQTDRTLIEAARTQRMRLGSAMIYGRLDERRTINDNVKRMIGSIVVAALACAICVGISFVTDLLAQRAAEQAAKNPAAIGMLLDGPLASELLDPPGGLL